MAQDRAPDAMEVRWSIIKHTMSDFMLLGEHCWTSAAYCTLLNPAHRKPTLGFMCTTQAPGQTNGVRSRVAHIKDLINVLKATKQAQVGQL